MKKLVVIFICLLMIFSNFSQAFIYITGRWAEDVIKWASKEGYFIGDDKGLLNPNNHITRAEFIVAFNRLAKINENTEVNYSDVKNSDRFYDAVSKLSAKGVLLNYGMLYPNKPIIREEVCYLVGKFYNGIGDLSGLKFNDNNEINSDYHAYVSGLVLSDVIHGTPEGNFNPKLNITRAETTKIIFNIVKNMDKLIFNKALEKVSEKN